MTTKNDSSASILEPLVENPDETEAQDRLQSANVEVTKPQVAPADVPDERITTEDINQLRRFLEEVNATYLEDINEINRSIEQLRARRRQLSTICRIFESIKEHGEYMLQIGLLLFGVLLEIILVLFIIGISYMLGNTGDLYMDSIKRTIFITKVVIISLLI